MSPIEKAWCTRHKTHQLIQQGVTILDCTVMSQEKCSEGRYLYQLVRILNRQRRELKAKPVDLYFHQIRSTTKGLHSLDTYLKYALTQTIHISAHGGIDKDTGKTILVAGNSIFKQDYVNELWLEFSPEERPLLVVFSACSAGHKDLIEAFSKAGCRYCIAPVFETDWERAALFSALFYTYLFLGEPVHPRDGSLPQLEPYGLEVAFEKAKKRLPKLTGWWKMFKDGDEILSR